MSKTYTQEQLDIEILKCQANGLRGDFFDLRKDLRELRNEIRSQFRGNIGLVLGAYVMITVDIAAKVFGAV